jgi:hypothetical protein
MKRFKFQIGDLVKHITLLSKLNRGFGVVVKITSDAPDKIDTIKCVWYDGRSSWIHKGQLKLITRGQNGKLS